MATQHLVFDVFLMIFSVCMVFTMVSEMYVSQKRAKIEMYVCMFGPKGMVIIDKIRVYIHFRFTFQIEMYVENRKVGMYVCMYDPGAPKPSVISVYPPTRKSKNRPQTVSRSTFSWRFWQGPVLRFSRSIHPSIHPYIHPYILSFYEGFLKPTVFYVC